MLLSMRGHRAAYFPGSLIVGQSRSTDLAQISLYLCILQEYSKWPTYPQLYANAELLGGCDIVLELAASKQLKAAVDEALSTSVEPQDPKAALHSRLKQLVTSHSVMLFMKVGCPYFDHAMVSYFVCLTNNMILCRHLSLSFTRAEQMALPFPCSPEAFADA